MVPQRIELAPEAPWQEAAGRAAEVLREGGVALLPAEGVYGLHALAEDPAAIERLLALKPRAGKKGFIGLIGAPRDAARYAEVSPSASALIEKHWPGALTVILPARADVPDAMKTPDGTIALRCPGNALLRAVVEASQGIVVSTSANEPGQPAMVLPEGGLAEAADLVVSQGKLSGIPSTLVTVQDDAMRVLREGAVRVTP